jgi:hypothetical protein
MGMLVLNSPWRRKWAMLLVLHQKASLKDSASDSCPLCFAHLARTSGDGAAVLGSVVLSKWQYERVSTLYLFLTVTDKRLITIPSLETSLSLGRVTFPNSQRVIVRA